MQRIYMTVGVAIDMAIGRLPAIALGFCLVPPMAFLFGWVPFLGFILWYLYFASVWGLGFQVAGLLLGIIALCKRKKYPGIKNLIFSIFSVVFPFIWFGFIYYLLRFTSVEMFL